VVESLTGQGICVQQACVALGVTQWGYYAWKGRPDAPRSLRRIWLAGEIADVDRESGGTYGALRVTAELKYGRGIAVGHNAVGHIMRQLGLKGAAAAAAAARREALQGDVAGHGRAQVPAGIVPTSCGSPTSPSTQPAKARCTAAWCWTPSRRKVVGWSIDSTQTTSLVLNALGMATQRRPDRDGLVIRSDRGGAIHRMGRQPQPHLGRHLPVDGRRRSAYDNALMESF
jgi:transposase InsO family protein